MEKEWLEKEFGRHVFTIESDNQVGGSAFRDAREQT